MMKNIFLLILVLCAFRSLAQEKKEFRYSVSYVAASVVYVDAGRDQNIAVDDTLRIFHMTTEIGKVMVTAVSRHSCAAQILSQTTPIAIGDDARINKIVQSVVVRQDTVKTVAAAELKQTPVVQREMGNDENIISGRVGIQYSGVIAEDSRLNLSQPSLLTRLDVRNLYGTGLIFSMYGRSYYDLSDIYSRYGDNSRLKNRVYEFSIQNQDPEASLGYGAGRMTSAYVGGMGTFDGGHVYYRYKNVTTGLLLGSKVQDRTTGVDANSKNGALFVNVRQGSDFLHQYDGTLAYARQLVKDKLEREFLYLQNHFMMGSEFSIYESTEIELNDINNGVKEKAFKLSNTYLSLNYYPMPWLSTNVGYDGSRTIYLFQTMKSISDTLLDKNLLQGYRGGATVRLPYFMSLGGNISYRTKKGDARDAYTLSGTYRISDILSSEIGAGIRYADIVGVYSDGSNFTLDVDRTFFYMLSLALRYDYYKYRVLSLHQTYVTQTATVNASYRISRNWYSSLSFDSVFDATMNSYRIYAEVGIRF
ncbi:MAG: hypothetical protein PHP42_03805 [Bacteroidota bacterium]|nr:hypothetical protein [Bacteroidota bacterium]